MRQAVIFDFDGLVLDTELPEYTAWCEIYETYGQVLRIATWGLAVGTRDGFDPYGHLEALTGRTLDRNALRSAWRSRAIELMQGISLLPGVHDRLEEACGLGWKVGIASSADADWVNRHLDSHDIRSYFDCLHCAATDGLPPKPAPDLYLAALRSLGVTSDQAVAFEDSPNGIAAAKAAGLYCIAVPNAVTGGLDLSAADEVIDSLAAVSLARLASG